MPSNYHGPSGVLLTPCFLAGRWKNPAHRGDYLGRCLAERQRSIIVNMVVCTAGEHGGGFYMRWAKKSCMWPRRFSLEACIRLGNHPYHLYYRRRFGACLRTMWYVCFSIGRAVIISIPLSLSNVGGMTNFLHQGARRF